MISGVLPKHPGLVRRADHVEAWLLRLERRFLLLFWGRLLSWGRFLSGIGGVFVELRIRNGAKPSAAGGGAGTQLQDAQEDDSRGEPAGEGSGYFHACCPIT